MPQQRTLLIHVLSRTVKQSLFLLWCMMLCVSCTIRSGEEVVFLQSAERQPSALAVRFVGSEGVMWRSIDGLLPDITYQLAVQAQLTSGAMQLRFDGDDTTRDPLVVVPGRVAVADYVVRSDAQGTIRIEEMTYQSRGGEYQLRFEPIGQPASP
ncbi:MAG: hypothetical protein FJ040_06380 [Chloroflexi bacterium]|nr:hypothetical protein [Chloroflexota bacterium]